MKKILNRMENRFVGTNLDILQYEENLVVQQAFIQKATFRRSVIGPLFLVAGLFAVYVNVPIMAILLLYIAINISTNTMFYIIFNEIINQNQLLGRLINGQTQNIQVLRKEPKGDDEENDY